MTAYDDDDLWRDAAGELADDGHEGYCRHCGSAVRRIVYRGRRPYMARFAEPDDERLECENCGEIDEDDVTGVG